ncbi:MAG: hypothetical protein GF350_16490 [Chitinivibrionales bacterium]|nr:hypothetical protein [Chitinivibrionales bacterium]
MVRRFSAACAALFLVQLKLFAVSGIGVCDFNYEMTNEPDLNGILASIVKNNHLIDTIHMVRTSGKLSARSSQINSYGTHCAFLYNDGGWWVAVTTIGGANKTIKKVVEMPGGDKGNGEIWTSLLEWPRGDWVWYTAEKENRNIYRANVKTVASQHVATFGVRSNQFCVSGDASIIVGAWNESGWAKLPDPDAISSARSLSAKGFLGGCGYGISPSGTFAIHNTGGCHCQVAIHTIDKENLTTTKIDTLGNRGSIGVVWGDVYYYMWDDWAVDSTLIHEAYDDDFVTSLGFQQVVGSGNHTLGGWSSNSDYWAVMFTGWAPEGRDLVSGSSILALGFFREEIMMFTHHTSTVDFARNPDQNMYIAWHGDVWISDPVEDIAPGYIDDFNNRDSYTIPGTDTELDPRMDALWSSVSAKNRNYAAFENIPDISDNGSMLEICDHDNMRVEIYAASGRLLYSRLAAEGWIEIPRKILSRGVNFLRIASGEKVLVSRKLFGL